MKEDQETKMSLQKAVLDKVVSHLGSMDESYYYESTMVVSHEAHRIIREEKLLTREEKELMERLSPNDLQLLMSYSSCC